MKRFFAIITVCLFAFGIANAQNEDKQKNYLPEQGEWSIGFDLKPIFKYVGNMFNANADNSIKYLGGEPVASELEGWDNSDVTPYASIMGKYMLSDQWAVRANVGLLLGSDITRAYVQDDEAKYLDPFNENKLIDTKQSRKNGMSVLLGAEYRKGSRRIQGVFGFGALVGFKNSTTVYNFANKVTSINQHPTNAIGAPAAANGYRVTKEKSTSEVFYGATGSAGFEWFVAPKVALGAEVNLSIYGISGGQEYTESEGWNKHKEEVETRYDIVNPGDVKFRFGTNNIGGSLYMSFYF